VTSANVCEQSTSRLRESATSTESSGPRSIVDTGTATAPSRIVARMPVNSSTSSTMHMTTRCSGWTPSAASPAATRPTSESRSV
jgi:hypothetical protein